MTIDKAIVDYINGLLDKYDIKKENRIQILCDCYVAALDAKNNLEINNYYGYVRAIVNGAIKPLVEKALQDDLGVNNNEQN